MTRPHAAGSRWTLGAAALLALGTGADGGDPPDDGVSFVPLAVEVGGRLLDVRFVDMDGDDRRDAVLAVEATDPGQPPRREIHIHAMDAGGALPVAPSQVIPVLDDVIVYGWADVRDEPGRELVFLTRTGAWSYSPRHANYRGNIRRLATMDLLFQVPSPHSLPSWSYLLEQEPRDLLLLPGGGGLTLWGPAGAAPGPAPGPPSPADPSPADPSPADPSPADPAAAPAQPAEPPDEYRQLARFGGNERGTLFSSKEPEALVVTSGGIRASIDTSDDGNVFLAETPAAFASMLEADAHYRAPALADVDGDGRTDLLLYKDDLLHVYLAGEQGLPDAPTRTEPRPAFLDKGSGDLILLPRDLDGDGDTDLLARLSPETRSVDPVVFTYFVMINDGTRLFADAPQQVLRFEGSGTESGLADVDSDGRPDLVVTKWVLPSLKDIVTGFRMERAAYVYFAGGENGEPFQRKPAIRDEQTFSIETLPDALVRRFLGGDVSGDGTADLVEVDLTGRVAIRRVVRERHLIGRDSWTIEEAPWRRFDMGADVEALQLEDINGDGVADIINPGTTTLALMLSRRGPEEESR